jgi:hypothetical protein
METRKLVQKLLMGRDTLTEGRDTTKLSLLKKQGMWHKKERSSSEQYFKIWFRSQEENITCLSRTSLS